MKKVGILGALEGEISGLVGMLEGAEAREHAYRRFFSGRLGNAQAVVVCCGIGKVNAAVCVQVLVDLYRVDCIINAGLAGGAAEGLSTGDVIISSEVCYHDIYPCHMISRDFGGRECFPADRELMELARESALGLEAPCRCRVGKIATGDQFIADKKAKDRIIADHRPLCMEMEGAAVAHAASLNKVPFLILRLISDMADEEADASFEEFLAGAEKLTNKIISGMCSRM